MGVTIDPRYLSYTKDEVEALLGAVPGKYEKPQTGIPATDLSQAVQDSLENASNAYRKPVGGIPSTDLSEEVNNALTAGSEALQFEEDNDPASLFNS